MGTSTFSEYTVVHEQSVAKVDMNAPLDKVSTAVRALAAVRLRAAHEHFTVAAYGKQEPECAGVRVSDAPRLCLQSTQLQAATTAHARTCPLPVRANAALLPPAAEISATTEHIHGKACLTP